MALGRQDQPCRQKANSLMQETTRKAMPLGVLRPVDLRTVWPHEAFDFSGWLGENLLQLNEALGLDLELVRPEAPVGNFSLDLLANVVGTQERAVIENQLERTDHDHLGKLLTYAAGYDATHVIWISSDLRDEHRAALDWLNNNTASNRNFFGVSVEALQIDDSRPAVIFKVLVSPNAWQKTKQQNAREREGSPDQEQLNAVYEAIYDLAKASGLFKRLLRPLGMYTDYVLERTHRSVGYAVAIGRNTLRAEVLLQFPDKNVNMALFEALQRRQAQIESAVKGEVFWDLKPEGRIRQVLRVSRDVQRDRLPELRDEVAQWAAERLMEFRSVIEIGLDTEVQAALSAAATDDDEGD